MYPPIDRVPVDTPCGGQQAAMIESRPTNLRTSARLMSQMGSKTTFGEEGPVLAQSGHSARHSCLQSQQRTFALICISDPAARALPDEEAQFHIAEGRSKTRIQRQ
jgi:hypothetical protein